MFLLFDIVFYVDLGEFNSETINPIHVVFPAIKMTRTTVIENVFPNVAVQFKSLMEFLRTQKSKTKLGLLCLTTC